MAAVIIGRITCPFCGSPDAHVKRTASKLAYLHCPNDGWLAHSRSRHQEQMLLGKMQPIGVPEPPAADRPIIVRDGVKVGAGAPPAPAPAEAPRKPASWIDQLIGGGGK